MDETEEVLEISGAEDEHARCDDGDDGAAHRDVTNREPSPA